MKGKLKSQKLMDIKLIKEFKTLEFYSCDYNEGRVLSLYRIDVERPEILKETPIHTSPFIQTYFGP